MRWIPVQCCLAGAGWTLAAAVLGGQVPRAGSLQPLPLTQLDERASAAELDRHLVNLSFTAPVPIREALVSLVQGSDVGIVADPDAAGTFIGDLKNVTLRQAFDLVLPPLGLDYTVENTVVRVFKREPDTRIFDLNYIAAERIGSSTIGGGDSRGSAAVSTSTRSDVFGDIAASVRALLSDHGSFSVDRKAGLLQATDTPERLDRIEAYLGAVQDRIHRQAEIVARVLEVELHDGNARGIDWAAVAARLGPSAGASGRSARTSPRDFLNGMRIADPDALLAALEAQGTVTEIASPRLLAMNNEPAIVRTAAVTFSVTPQIANDAHFTLSLSPIVHTPAAAEADLLARVADGETLVVAGLGRDRETRDRKPVGTSGGWFGRATVVTRQRTELVILVTPRVVPGSAE